MFVATAAEEARVRRDVSSSPRASSFLDGQAELHDLGADSRRCIEDGFEIGNHTRDHMGVSAQTAGRLPGQLSHISDRCKEHGIPSPVSFAWPGNAFHTNALPMLRAAGIRFARRGGEPEVPYKEGGGIAYEPGVDHPLLIPTTGDARPDWTLNSLKRAVRMARAGRIAVLQFHGVPDGEHPWVNTPRERFEEYMAWLHAEGFKVIAMRGSRHLRG
jgi:peptidoglycan/xylan/chitin deacetylase (PgdA/CDA1 family)